MATLQRNWPQSFSMLVKLKSSGTALYGQKKCWKATCDMRTLQVQHWEAKPPQAVHAGLVLKPLKSPARLRKKSKCQTGEPNHYAWPASSCFSAWDGFFAPIEWHGMASWVKVSKILAEIQSKCTSLSQAPWVGLPVAGYWSESQSSVATRNMWKQGKFGQVKVFRWRYTSSFKVYLI
jgi:hypothetical protein